MPIRLTPAVKGLLIAFLAAFLVQQTADQFFGAHWLEVLALTPADVVIRGRIWQLLTYAFLHQDVSHLVWNSVLLVFVGSELEGLWGRKRFLAFLAVCASVGGVVYLLLQVFTQGQGLHQPMVGASSALYGLLAAFGLLFGDRTMLFMFVFPMKAKHMVLLLGGIEFLSTLYSARGGLSSLAHLSGMMAGVTYLWVWTLLRGRLRMARKDPNRKPLLSWPARIVKKRGGKHLKLVINNEKDFDKDDPPGDGKPTSWH